MAYSSKAHSKPRPRQHASNFADLGRTMRGREWMKEFETGFTERVKSSGIVFRPARYPNIMYVFGDAIEKASRRGQALAGASDTDNAVDLLIQKDVIAEDLARGGLTIHVDRLHLRARHSADPHVNISSMGAYVDDKEARDYPDGFVVAGEKRAIRGKLEVRQNQQYFHGVPSHFLFLGNVISQEQVVGDGLLRDLRGTLSDEVNFGPVIGMDARATVRGIEPVPGQ